MTEGEREMRPGRFHLVSRGAEHSALLSSIDEDAGPARTGEKGRNLNGATCEPPRELPGGGGDSLPQSSIKPYCTSSVHFRFRSMTPHYNSV